MDLGVCGLWIRFGIAWINKGLQVCYCVLVCLLFVFFRLFSVVLGGVVIRLFLRWVG